MNRLLLFPLLLFAQFALAQQLLSHETFARHYAERVRAVYPGVSAQVVGDLELSIDNEAGKSVTSYLDNAYAQYKAEPALLDDIIATYVQSLASVLDDQAATGDRADLVPVIKDLAYLNEVSALMAHKRESGDEAVGELYSEALNGDLVVLYAFYSELSMRYATGDDIGEMGLGRAELRAFALANLMRRLPDVAREGDDSLSMLTADGTFEASLLLLDGIWTKDNFAVKGDIVVFVPARDVVLVTGSKDRDGLARAREIVRDNDWTYPVSALAFVRKRGAWTRFDR